MEQWLRDTFDVIDNEVTFELRRDGLEPVKIIFQLDWFISVFGSVPVPPTARALKAVDPENQLGWHNHFDAWVAQGIIEP